MKRMAIFIFYDECGRLDEYAQFLLKSIKIIAQKLLAVVNGRIGDRDRQILRIYANEVFIRENKGYDAGAYKDAVIKFIPSEEWKNWDEVILLNDTFYGPVYPWKEIFDKMEAKDADFWGLSRYPGGGGKLSGGAEIPEHIQAYFLVCRRKLFLSPQWQRFWRELPYVHTHKLAVEQFEISFSVYFSGKGFSSKAFTDEGNISVQYGVNPYIQYAYELLKDARFPVIKRRAVTAMNLMNAKKALAYIDKNTDYNTSMIYSNLKRLHAEERLMLFERFSRTQLECFCHRHNRVFIYGHGLYGKNLAEYFAYKGWTNAGFIISSNSSNDADALIFQEMEFEPEDGIILALGKSALLEVYPVVRQKLKEEQLFLPDN